MVGNFKQRVVAIAHSGDRPWHPAAYGTNGTGGQLRAEQHTLRSTGKVVPYSRVDAWPIGVAIARSGDRPWHPPAYGTNGTKGRSRAERYKTVPYADTLRRDLWIPRGWGHRNPYWRCAWLDAILLGVSSYPPRRTQRLPGYNYTTPGFYFVTLCIQDRLPLFGAVTAGTMHRSVSGTMVQEVIEAVPLRSPDVLVDTLMIMPDHVHAVVSLTGETRSLSEVIRNLKSRSTVEYVHGVRDAGWPLFAGRLWQKGFYDRVIRDDRELSAVRAYVVQNPLRWSLREEERN